MLEVHAANHALDLLEGPDGCSLTKADCEALKDFIDRLINHIERKDDALRKVRDLVNKLVRDEWERFP